MKKFLLSFFFLTAFADYSIAEQNRNPVPPILAQNKSTDSSLAAVSVAPIADPSSMVEKAVTFISSDDDEEDDGVRVPAVKAVPVKVVTPKKVVIAPASTPAPKNPIGVYKDGEYIGSVADAYYGNVQVKALIAGGKIADVQFLDHPSDRRTSIEINDYAMPILKSEAIQSQNAQVDVVSGASDTSAAFQESLAVALNQAKNS